MAIGTDERRRCGHPERDHTITWYECASCPDGGCISFTPAEDR